MKTRGLLLAALAGASLCAAADDYRIDPSHTAAYFAADHLGFSTQRGRFDRISGNLSLDVKRKTGRVEVRIDATSLSSGDEKRDAALKGRSFFDVERHPEIRFVGSDFDWEGEWPSAVHGELTLLGRSRPLTLTIRRMKCGFHLFDFGRACGADAGTTLRRSDFGMDAWLSAIGDEVAIDLQVEAIRQ